MARYYYRGTGPSLFSAQAGGPLQDSLIYVRETQFALHNPDGSKTYYDGRNLVWNAGQGAFTGGVITGITHYNMAGAYVDSMTGLAIKASELQPLLAAANSNDGVAALVAALMPGRDILTGESGNDTLLGGAGNDLIRGGAGADTIDGGEGRDWAGYWFSDAGVTVDLNTGKGQGGHAEGDRLSNIENLEGSHHDDVLLGNAHANRIDGHEGHDRLSGGDGNDTLRTGSGNDVAAGGNGRDTITGGVGHDDLRGESGNDRLDGGDGDDFLTGGDGEDFILGGDGNDTIDAGAGRDIVHGGKGNDVIYGGPDPDVIVYDYGWTQIKARYDGSDYSIWIEAPDGKDHVFSALTFATTTGTYRFDVPSQSWVLDSTKTSADWLASP